MDVVRVLVAILLLGNIQFVEGMNQQVTVQSNEEIEKVAKLLGVSVDDLFRGLTTQTHISRGQVVKSMCDINMSIMTRDALAKALYCRTVSSIVRRANSIKRHTSTAGTLSSNSNESVHNQIEITSQHPSTVGTGGSQHSKSMTALNNAIRRVNEGCIGILDMFGFEGAKPSQLEHLCVNLCAEAMQHFYNRQILKTNAEACRDEGIPCEVNVEQELEVPVLDLISTLKTGLLSLLDNECMVRGGSPELFVKKAKAQHKKNSRLFEPESLDPRIFGIHHFAGKIIYDASSFLEVNKDLVRDDIVSIFHKQTCNFGFATHLFSSELKVLSSDKPIPRGMPFRILPSQQKQGLSDNTFTAEFHEQLNKLLQFLVKSKSHFIWCVRSNPREESLRFNRMTVVQQIRSLQIFETCNLMAGGFPHRMRYRQFNNRFRMIAPCGKMRRTDDKSVDNCKLILEYYMKVVTDFMKMSSGNCNWAFGRDHIYYNEITRQQLEKLRSDILHRSATLIQATWRGYHFRCHWQTLKRNLELRARTRNARPRPQPIAGTPPPDIMDRCDPKTIQQTCTKYGLDMERPPPLPASRSYTVSGNRKLGYPQNRVMKNTYPEDGTGSIVLPQGETVFVVGASPKRGYLIVQYKNHNIDVPYQFLELKTSHRGMDI